jgi:hypothetical protein
MCPRTQLRAGVKSGGRVGKQETLLVRALKSCEKALTRTDPLPKSLSLIGRWRARIGLSGG